MKSSGSKKGISPLIAAVLLIAFTITVAGILATWANITMKSKTKGLEEETAKLEKCNAANIQIEDDAIDFQGLGDADETNNNIVLRVTNLGGVALENWKLNVFKKGGVNFTEIEPVNDKKIEKKYGTLTFSDVGNATELEKVELLSSDCPELAAYTCDYKGDGNFDC